MRLRKNQSDTSEATGEPRGRRRREGRGWGPFSGGQLTVVVVAIVVVLIPTAAMAAIGTFTSTTTTPAVTGTNSSTAAGAKGIFGQQTGGGANTRYGAVGNANGTAGIGVQGTGAKFGVFSNGPLGVTFGQPLSCSGCVGSGAIALNARSLSNAYGGSGSVVLTNSGESQVASFLVPAGNYLINWSAQFWANASVANGVCYVELGDDALQQYDMAETGLAAAFPPGVLRGAAASTDVIANVPAGHASLHCFANVDSTHVTGSLTMLKVGTVSH
jgi:hypothetical protein